MIESFRVQNYKALRDVEVKLTPMHVLIGPNDSGKTSVLEALGALCRSVDRQSFGHAFVGAWNGPELSWGGRNDPILLSAKVRVQGEEVAYSLRLRFSGSVRYALIFSET